MEEAIPSATRRFAITLQARDYHVVLLAAIRKEYVIACALLDQRHNDPPDRLEDQRLYTFGRIHQHNVVIARLPEGTVGIDASAAVAADLANSFPQLRFGIMVGIAGGAPTRNTDIRLGDIVVSVPSDKGRSGGVIQYDFGASIQTKGIARRGWLDRPPQVLLYAVGELQARHENDGHDIDGAVERMLRNNGEGRLDAYKRPTVGRDLLFMPDFVHQDEIRTCEEIGCHTATNKIIIRPERRMPSDQVVIHLGTIGSGGLLMRDAALRDQTAQEDGVICFEMESAGLMNSRLPWLVIRGISDYSDSHKHDEWQNYAAAVAAVYAKELLSIVPPVLIAKTSRDHEAGDTLETLDLFRFLEYDRMDFKRQFAMPESSFDLEWIWDTTFKDWLCNRTSNKPYWVCGKPGSGKSTLMAYLSHSLRTRTMLDNAAIHIQILHFFYDYRAGANLANSIEGMLRMLLYQLAKTIKTIRLYLQQSLREHQQDHGSLNSLLDKVCEALTQQDLQVCIFVDGLDEYEGNYVELLQTCRIIINRTGARMCIASRPDVPVTGILQVYSQVLLQNYNRSSMQSYAKESILAASHNNAGIKNLMSKSLQQTLMLKAEGIILWFRLAFDEAMMMCLAGTGEEDVEIFLQEIPPGLDAMYRRILGLLPRAHLNECALLLFMVREFSETAELTRNSEITSLDHLWAAYDLLSAGSEKYLNRGVILGIDEFRDYLRVMLRGLIEVVTSESSWRYEFDVRLLHRTFAAFIDKSRWIEENLHRHFKQNYPDAFALRFYASVIERAATDNVVSRDQREICLRELCKFGLPSDDRNIKQYFKTGYAAVKAVPILNGKRSLTLAISMTFYRHENEWTWRRRRNDPVYTLLSWSIYSLLLMASACYIVPSGWHVRRRLLGIAIGQTLKLAKHYERHKDSVHSIIDSALRSSLDTSIVFASANMSLTRFPWQVGMDPRFQGHLHLFILIHHRLTGAFIESLAGVEIPLELRGELLTSVIVEHALCSAAAPGDLPQLFDRIVSERKVIRTHHICNLLSERACLQDSADVASHLLPYLTTTNQDLIDDQDRSFCRFHGSHCNLLLRWALRTRCCYRGQFDKGIEHDEHRDEARRRGNFFHNLLSLIVSYGIDINERCYTRGTVLHTILGASTIEMQDPYGKSDAHYGRWFSLQTTWQKFCALVAHGIDPTVRNKRGVTALRIAQKSRAKLLKHRRLRNQHPSIEHSLGRIVACLEEYERTDDWPADLLIDVALLCDIG